MRAKNLVWPMAGLDRGTSYPGQPPFSCIDALNVRPRETVEGRIRGGSRPGLLRISESPVDAGSQNPVRLLSQLRYLNATAAGSLEYAFDKISSFPSGWAGAEFPYEFLPLIGGAWMSRQRLYVDAAVSTVGMVHQRLPLMDLAQPFTITLELDYPAGWRPTATDIPGTLNHPAGEYTILFGMDDDVPEKDQDSILITFSQDGAQLSWSWRIRQAGVTTSSDAGVSDIGAPNEARVVVDATMRFEVSKGDDFFDVFTGIAIPTPLAGTRMGVLMESTTGPFEYPLISRFGLIYIRTIFNDAVNRIVAGIGGKLYARAALTDQVMTPVGGEGDTPRLSDDKLLMAQERYQELFIADYGAQKVAGVTITATISASGGDYSLVDTAVADFTDLGIVDADGCYIAGTTGGDQRNVNVFRIKTINSGSLILDGSVHTLFGLPLTCNYEVAPFPKVYRPLEALTYGHWQADRYGAGDPIHTENDVKGIVPQGCPIIAAFQNRIILAGNPPHVFYMSRQDDPYDWNFGDDPSDPARAIGGVISPFSRLSGPIKAVVTWTQDTCLFFCTRSIEMMLGDIGAGGQIVNRSRIVGAVDKGAVCIGPGNEVIFLSHDGLYAMAGGPPEPLSRQRLPLELRNLDASAITVTMVYDPRGRGIHINLTGTLSSSGLRHWWFDWDTKSFWPVELQVDHEACSLLGYDPDIGSEPEVLLGCRDGGIRHYDRSAAADSGQPIASYVVIGPILLGQPGLTDGIITEMVAVLGAASAGVTWTVTLGRTAEEAWKDPLYTRTGSFLGSLNAATRTKMRGSVAYIRLTAADQTAAWQLETLVAMIAAGGRVRIA
jgi:hypothetical protein